MASRQPYLRQYLKNEYIIQIHVHIMIYTYIYVVSHRAHGSMYIFRVTTLVTISKGLSGNYE